MNSFLRRSPFLLPLLAFVFPSLAHAHVGVGEASGLLHGFWHPVSGLDHVCAMVAVGLWAAQCGGRARWLVPLAFVSVMAVGGILGTAGVSVPFVEEGIVVSVLVLGVLIAAAVRLPLVASVTVVGLFALFHGHAHGVEMPRTASGLAYGTSFLLATALLHGAGLSLVLVVKWMGRMSFVRFVGSAIAVCGVYLCFA